MFSYLRKHNSILKKEKQDVSHNISVPTLCQKMAVFGIKNGVSLYLDLGL